MAKLLKKLGEMLHQLAYDRRLSTTYIWSVNLMHMVGYALASIPCVEGPYYHCEYGYAMHFEIKLVIPCFSFVVSNTEKQNKFECDFRIHHSMAAQQCFILRNGFSLDLIKIIIIKTFS